MGKEVMIASETSISAIRNGTDEGEYCSFASLFPVARDAMKENGLITQKHFFAALEKLGIVEKKEYTKQNIWTPPEDIAKKMIDDKLSHYLVYRRRSNIDGSGHNHSFGFDCANKNIEIDLMEPVVRELDMLQSLLEKADNEIDVMISVIKQAGGTVNMVNQEVIIERAIEQWKKQ